MFDVANWVACLNGENGPGGTPSHEPLSVSPQRALEISSVIGQPPSLDRNHFSTPRVVAESHKCDERSIPKTTVSNSLEKLGRSLRANLYKGSLVRQGKQATHKCSRAEGGFSGPSRFKDQCHNQTVLVAMDISTVEAYINKQGATHSAEMCALM